MFVACAVEMGFISGDYGDPVRGESGLILLKDTEIDLIDAQLKNKDATLPSWLYFLFYII